MKKLLTLSIFILLSANSIFSTIYLVQNGGATDATWRTPLSGEVLVDLTSLSKTLNAWHLSSVSADDEVWIAKGTYVLDASLVMKSGEKIYGGFIGTEIAVGERAKATKMWEFTNTTVLDGNNALVIFNNSSALSNPTLIDGLTITKGKNLSSGYNMSGSGAKLNGNMTMQNCIVSYCVSEYTSGVGGGGVGLNSNSYLKDSYIHHNTSAAAKNAGGVYMFAGSKMTGCTIDSNTAPGNCGGVYVFNNSADGVGPIIENCSIINNIATSGNAGGIMVYTSSATKKFTTQVIISDCIIKGNSTSNVAGGGIYLNDGFSPNGYLFKNCVIEGNLTPGNGAAVGINASLATTFVNCIMTNNKGLDFVNSSLSANAALFQNCTFSSNKNAEGTSAVGMTLSNTTLASTLSNCIFYDCSAIPIVAGITPAVTYCGFESTVTLPVGTGNIATIEAASFTDAVNGDFHLASGATAINSGTTIAGISTDIEGTARPQGAAYDMGAYEYSVGTNLHNAYNESSLVFHNRSTKTVQVNASAGSTIMIVNMLGEVVKSEMINSNNMTFSTANIPSGVYVIQLIHQGKKNAQKIIF